MNTRFSWRHEVFIAEDSTAYAYLDPDATALQAERECAAHPLDALDEETELLELCVRQRLPARAEQCLTAEAVEQKARHLVRYFISSVSGCCAYHPNQNARCAGTLASPTAGSKVAWNG